MKQCFVLMPFAQQYNEVYNHVIKRACEEAGYGCQRADKLNGSGNIMKSVIQGILAADVVIADLSEHNPNVFYELAVSHSYGKEVIMISQGLGDLPFDISQYRVIRYTQNIEGGDLLRSQLRTELEKAGTSALSNPVIDNAGHALAIEPERVPALVVEVNPRIPPFYGAMIGHRFGDRREEHMATLFAASVVVRNPNKAGVSIIGISLDDGIGVLLANEAQPVEFREVQFYMMGRSLECDEGAHGFAFEPFLHDRNMRLEPYDGRSGFLLFWQRPPHGDLSGERAATLTMDASAGTQRIPLLFRAVDERILTLLKGPHPLGYRE